MTGWKDKTRLGKVAHDAHRKSIAPDDFYSVDGDWDAVAVAVLDALIVEVDKEFRADGTYTAYGIADWLRAKKETG